MLWLYWRRIRLMVAGFAIAVLLAAALALLASTVGGARRPVATRGAGRLPDALPLRRGPVTDPDAAKVRRGLVLMNAAATACRTVAYHGLQMVAWSASGGSDAYLIEVWHRAGQSELAAGDDDMDDHVPGTSAGGDAAVGVLSLSPRMLGLMRANYLIEYAGSGSSSSRPALIVAVWRHDGTLAARYWLDQVTGLPLRREVFDSRGRLVNEGAFIDLEIGAKGIGRLPAASARAWSTQLSARRLPALRKRGWTVPGMLASDLTLVGLTTTATRSGPILDASYSDGLSVISVFMQRGQLPASLPGWQRAMVSGDQVYLTQPSGLGERGLAWSSGGYVYTVIADAPQDTVTAVVAQLPHNQHDGFWVRVGLGLKRIGSWFDPFG